VNDGVLISQRVLDASGREYTVTADASNWAELADSVGEALRRLDAAAAIVTRVCPECRVDLNDMHRIDCSFRGES
jgi:hypothetical protein